MVRFKSALVAVLLLLQCPLVLAVNRCTIDGKTVYQDPPCPGTLGTVGEEIADKENQRRVSAQQEAQRAAGQRQREEMKASFDAAIKQMANYSVAIGRGIACDAPGTHEAYRRLVAWMDAKGLTKDYMPVATATIREATKRQREGITPDPCTEVRAEFARYPWP